MAAYLRRHFPQVNPADVGHRAFRYLLIVYHRKGTQDRNHQKQSGDKNQYDMLISLFLCLFNPPPPFRPQGLFICPAPNR